MRICGNSQAKASEGLNARSVQRQQQRQSERSGSVSLELHLYVVKPACQYIAIVQDRRWKRTLRLTREFKKPDHNTVFEFRRAGPGGGDIQKAQRLENASFVRS